MWGIFFSPLGGGVGNTGKEVGLRGGFDHKLKRTSRIKLNEDIQHVGETKRFFETLAKALDDVKLQY